MKPNQKKNRNKKCKIHAGNCKGHKVVYDEKYIYWYDDWTIMGKVRKETK